MTNGASPHKKENTTQKPVKSETKEKPVKHEPKKAD
jgi:hypothetical protein